MELASLVRPRLDLTCDEVDSQLGQHLPHRRRERAPLCLVERQHRTSASEADLFVRAVAERLVAGTAAAAQRGLLAFVENVALGVEDPDAAGDEQWPIRRGAHLGRLLPL